MTQKQFWEAFERIAKQRNKKFVLDDKGQIRQQNAERACPVCAVANDQSVAKYYGLNYIAAATAIKLDLSFAQLIVDAADNDMRTNKADIRVTRFRKRLLALSGIKEVQPHRNKTTIPPNRLQKPVKIF